MPQSTAKSQASKEKSMASTRVSPPPPQEPEEIVPPRLLRGHWTNMLIQEEATEKVGVIVNELVSRVMDGCLKVFIQSQLAPHSASWARNHIIQVLEQKIICPDEGEEPEEASKTEDSEPVPAPYDAWAQGCVPVIRPTAAQPGMESGQVSAQTEPRINQQSISLKQAMKDQRHFPSPSSLDHMKQQQVDTTSRPAQGTVLPPLSTSAVRKDVSGDSTKRIYISGPLYQHKVDSDHTTSTIAKINGPSKQESKNAKQQPERPVTTLPPLTTAKEKSTKSRRSK